MLQLEGVYTYNIPRSITHEIEGVRLYKISEDPGLNEAIPNPEAITLLITRQGNVNRMLQEFPNVKWLQLLNAGYELVDLDLLRERDITFTNARSVYCKTIAEDVFAKILFLARNYMVHLKDQRNNFWPNDIQLPNYNLDIAEKTIGILGAGSIGREIAIRAKAFEMKVIGFDPYLETQVAFDKIYNKTEDLYEVLRISDFIVTCLPVTSETRDIMNKDTFSLMKKNSFFINVARGEVVDESALIYALDNGIIRGAFIDVSKEEPLDFQSPLWKTKNLFITPHRAAYGDLMEQRMCELIETNILHYRAREPLENLVDI